MSCPAHTAQHDGRDPQRYVHHLPDARAVLCAGCLAAFTSMGMDWRLEKRADERRADRGTVERFAVAFRRIAA